MTYPGTRDTFPPQYDFGTPGATNATAEFINGVTAVLVALEDKLGLDTDAAATSGGPSATVEARLKRMEASPLAQSVTFSPTQPTSAVPHDVWIDTTSSPWKYYYFTAAGTTGWELVGANAAQIGGRDVDPTAPTINNQPLVWDSATSKVKFGAPLPTNPFTTQGDLIIGSVPDGSGNVGFDVLHRGTEGQALVVQGSTPVWMTPPWIRNSTFTARGQLLVGTGASNYSVLSNSGGTDAGKVLGIDGTGYPAWLSDYRPIPITNNNDIFFGTADGAVHRIGGGDDNANANKALTIIPGSFGFGPTLGWQSPTPLTTVGDILYVNDGPTSDRLPVGPNGYVLTVVSGKPAWAAGGSGGTGIAGVTIQDEGAPQGGAGTITTLNFVGAGVAATVSGGTATITIGGGGGGGGSGTVTSAGIMLPSIFNVIGSPITNSGTITATLANQNAGSFLAGPASGASAPPSFRAINPNDLPLFGPSGTGHAAGAVPDPGNIPGNTRFLREDGIFAAPTGTGGSGGMADPMSAAGDLIYRNTSNLTTRLALTGRSNGDVLTVVDMGTGLIGWRPPVGGGGGGAGTIIVEDEGGTGVAASILNVTGPGIAVSVATGIATLTVTNFTSSAAGTVPSSGGGTTNFLRADGTWAGVTINVEDEGGTPAAVSTINFVGPGIIVTAVGTTATVGVPYFTTATAGVAVGPSSTEDDADHVLTGANTWRDVATLPGGGSGDATSIQGVAVSATAPSTGQVLEYNGTNYVPTTPSGGGGATSAWATREGTVTAPPAQGAWDHYDHLTAGTTIVNFTGGVMITIPGQSGDLLCSAMMNAPGTPWTRTVCFAEMGPGINSSQVGLIVGEAGSAKLITCEINLADNAVQIAVDHWTNDSAWSGNDFVKAWNDPVMWARVTDNGTNLIFEVSHDGSAGTWTTVYSASRSAFLTAPDRVGIFANAHNVTYGLQGKFYSFG